MSIRRLLIPVVLSLAALIPSFALASSARLEGLNVPGDYVKDAAGVHTYLSGLATQSDRVWIDPTPGGRTSMGASLSKLWDGRTGTWQLNLRRFAPSLGGELVGDPIATSALGFRDPNLTGQSLDLMWGHRLGNGSFGMRLNRSFISNESPAGKTEGDGNLARDVWGLGAGYGFNFGEGRDAELSLLWQQRTFKGTDFTTPSLAEDAGSNSFLIAGRAFVRTSGTLTVVPNARLWQFDLAAADAGGAVTDALLSGWQVGLAGNWTIGSNDLFVLGAQFLNNRNEQTSPGNPQQVVIEKYYPNVFMALETQVNSWLTLRFGAQEAISHIDDRNVGLPAPVQSIAKSHAFSLSTGATVKVGALVFDATLDPAFYNNPVSGTFNNGLGGLNPPFAHVSATYAF